MYYSAYTHDRTRVRPERDIYRVRVGVYVCSSHVDNAVLLRPRDCLSK